MKKYNLTSDFKHQLLSSGGFTLLEILIAVTLLAFITIGVVSVTENATSTMERTNEINNNNLQIETALSRFEWDLSQIYSPLYFSTVMNMNPTQYGNVDAGTVPGAPPPQPNPELQAYFEQLATRFDGNEHFSSVSKDGIPIPRFYSPEKNVFEFFTTSNRRKVQNIKQSHFAWVRYALADQQIDNTEERNPNIPPSLKALVRYFAPDDPYGDKRIDIADVDKVKGAVLLENVEKLEFEFWDDKRKKWESSLRTIQDGESLVRGVKMLLTWYDSNGHKRNISRIFRTHWPMVRPEDPAPTRPNTGTTAGTTTGAAGGNGQADAGDPPNE